VKRSNTVRMAVETASSGSSRTSPSSSPHTSPTGSPRRSSPRAALLRMPPSNRARRMWISASYADLEIMLTSGAFQFRFSQIDRHNQRGSGYTDGFEYRPFGEAGCPADDC